MPLRCSQDYTAQAPWLPGASSQLIGRGRSSVYWLVSLVCFLLSSHPLSSNCTTQHAGQNLGWLRYCERIHTGWTHVVCAFLVSITVQFNLQHNGVVKANIGECPVHYHHLCVEDFSSQLQQAEHCTPMKFYKGGKRKKHHTLRPTNSFHSIASIKTNFQLQTRVTCCCFNNYWGQRVERASDFSFLRFSTWKSRMLI